MRILRTHMCCIQVHCQGCPMLHWLLHHWCGLGTRNSFDKLRRYRRWGEVWWWPCKRSIGGDKKVLYQRMRKMMPVERRHVIWVDSRPRYSQEKSLDRWGTGIGGSWHRYVQASCIGSKFHDSKDGHRWGMHHGYCQSTRLQCKWWQLLLL